MLYTIIYIVISCIITALGILAAIKAIQSYWVSILRGSGTGKKRREGLLMAGIAIMLAIAQIYGWLKLNPETLQSYFEKPAISVGHPIDISGTYTGYFIDEAGKRVPTYLKIESPHPFSKYITVHLRNSFSTSYPASYEIDTKELEIEGIGKGNVHKKDGDVIIESQENETRIWKFIKRQ